MNHDNRRLLKKAELIKILQLEPSDVDWLISTAQIRPVRIRGQERFDSKDIYQFIESYKIIQGRRAQ